MKCMERQDVLTLHRARELLVRQRTALINAIRGHCAEFGFVVSQGARRIGELIETARERRPSPARGASLRSEPSRRAARRPGGRIRALDLRLLAWNRRDAVSQRLATIPGIGVLTATALSASVADPAAFRSGREFAAFLGLVPR